MHAYYRRSMMGIGVFVCMLDSEHNHKPYKNGSNDRGAVWVMDSGVSKEPCARWGPDPPRANSNFRGTSPRSLQNVQKYAA